jgi:hypothetical protein
MVCDGVQVFAMVIIYRASAFGVLKSEELQRPHQ